MLQQEVEYVKQEAKLPYLLECLQKTAPPVLIFAENKARACCATVCQHVGCGLTPHIYGGLLWTASGVQQLPSLSKHVADTTPGSTQADVDDIHERLLTVAVEAVSIHGGKDQEEREQAIQHFKAGTKVRCGPLGLACVASSLLALCFSPAVQVKAVAATHVTGVAVCCTVLCEAVC
jgi:ATP-dependent RNA helicase DDX41